MKYSFTSDYLKLKGQSSEKWYMYDKYYSLVVEWIGTCMKFKVLKNNVNKRIKKKFTVGRIKKKYSRKKWR